MVRRLLSKTIRRGWVSSAEGLLIALLALSVLAWSRGSGEPSAPRGTGFELTRQTVAGGGVMFSTAGEFELSGSIGQPDVGTMTGGNLTLTAGFWFGIPPGDCEDDGDVDLLDYNRFESCLTGPDGGVAAGCECFDVNRSGTVDLLDFAVAQTTFTGS